MEYITTKEAAAKWGISTIRITVLANEGRIPGAKRLGRSWLIPADATKPVKLKANHSNSPSEKSDQFSFPLYHFSPDLSYIREKELSMQQRNLMLAETAVLECRYADAYPMLKAILNAPDDVYVEIGCLWNAGLCCIALNKAEDFSKIFLRLQIILSEDFPHRDDLVIVLDTLKTFVETLGSSAKNINFNANINDQCLPLSCLHIGYAHLTSEATSLGTADTTLLEIILRLLKSTSSVISMEMMHCHLLGIYFIRQDMDNATKHARAMVKIAYESKFYFPLVTYYRYLSEALAPILEEYPKEFQNHCYELISQYEVNFTAFISSIDKFTVISTLTDEDFPYIYAVLTNLSNTAIADKMGISKPTVNRKLLTLYNKLGVSNKQELKEYLINNM